MRNVTKMLPAAGLVLVGLVFLLTTGCDLLGDDDDEKDGTLTVSVSGVPSEICENDETLFAVFVMNAGASVDEDWDAEEWVGLVAVEVENDSASGTAFIADQGDTRPDWTGTGGSSYDVYPTIYCVTFGEGAPTKGENAFYLVDADLVYDKADWSAPITYKQDGNKSISTAFEEYEPTGN